MPVVAHCLVHLHVGHACSLLAYSVLSWHYQGMVMVCSNPIMFVFCIMPSSHSMYHCHLDSISHLDPLNYPLTNANKNTITVEDSSS